MSVCRTRAGWPAREGEAQEAQVDHGVQARQPQVVRAVLVEQRFLLHGDLLEVADVLIVPRVTRRAKGTESIQIESSGEESRLGDGGWSSRVEAIGLESSGSS